MKSKWIAVAACAVAGAFATPAHAAGSERVIVVLEPGTSPAAVAKSHARRYGLDVGHVYSHALRGYSAVVPAERAAALRADADVALVSKDGTAHATAQTLPTGVNRIQGDVSSTLSGNGSGSVGVGVGVAVIDTGIDPTHPDLNVAGGVNCSTGTSYADGNGHGSHVAGTIAAKDDGAGVVGVAPGASLYAVRVLNNNGSGSWSDVACGIDWVTAHAGQIKVANMSLGGTGSDGTCASDALHRAICNSVNAGVTYVVAAGNDGKNFSGYAPATYDQVLTVTAEADFNGAPGGGAAPTCRSDVDETAADFSNYASPGSADAGHAIAAPGVCILSTWKRGGYNTISGTSMATPHVTGTAALCIASGRCTGTPAQIAARLRADAAAQPVSYGFSGDLNSPLSGRYYGALAYAGGY